MEEHYRLVFRGEVLDGHHPAVVKKKLGELLKVAGERLDELFAGKFVVVRRDADAAEAARYQAAFKKAGARLRLQPIDPTASPPSDGPTPDEARQALDLAPLGEDLLRPEERRRVANPNIDVEHLTLAAVDAELPRPPPRIVRTAAVPDWKIAPVGERLLDAESEEEAAEAEVEVAVASPSWSIAPPGERLVKERPAPVPAVDLATIDFSLAPEGTRLQLARPAGPPPPDTSHLSLEELPPA